ncbi:MAG: efflux RND transporter periplasmic adaptor subunit, partial [Caulobacteraceae bacterium]
MSNTHVSHTDADAAYGGPAGPTETPVSSGRLKLVGACAVAVLVAVVVVGASNRSAAHRNLTAATTEAATPTVSVVQPKATSAGVIALPGRLQAWSEAPVYARTNGYLHQWFADIGDHVKAGQVLATIETPDVDQQLAAATAALATADAQRKLADLTAQRWQRLVKVHAVSQQETDQREGDLAARQAMENEARANVSRLQTLTDFKNIVAPFDGVVTSRSTDIGALIVAGDARATPLFSVADNGRLRLYVSVPQNYAAAIKPGTTAQFTVPDRPGQTFSASVVGLAGEVNAQSGAMQIQLLFNNSAGLLKPGAYAQVNFNIPQAAA